jgi:hypothetical protein
MKWLADENFDNSIVRGILRRSPGFDVVRAQDVPEISGKADLALLAWATENSRVVLTHDLSTMIPAMEALLKDGSCCAPIVLVSDSLPTGSVIEEILILDECSIETDWASGVLYLPLQ